MKIAVLTIAGIIGLLIAVTVIEIIFTIIRNKPSIDNYNRSDYPDTGRLLYLMYKKENNEQVDEGKISELIYTSINFVEHRYDCSDFRVIILIRALKDYGKYLTKQQYDDIKKCILGFRYWMDQPTKGDSLCFWSENHQLIFAVSEYLLGDMFPEEIFTNDGKTGAEHKKLAENRIDIWLQHRFDYGYSEWNSNNYLPEVLAPAANFIQYSTDEARVNKMKMAIDLLWLDIALGSLRFQKDERLYYLFNTTSGRAYSDNKISDKIGNLLRTNMESLLLGEKARYGEDGWESKHDARVMLFRLMIHAKKPSGEPYYQLPNAIREIFDADYNKGIELKQSNSLDVEELLSDKLVGLKDREIMQQFGMEAFTDYRIINNTLKYLRKNKMLTNSFLSPFRYFNSLVLMKLGVLKALSRHIPLLSNGAALERANIYVYKTADYVMSTAQEYQPGNFGAQQHIWTMSLSDELSIFTTQPAKRFGEDGSPSYWVGNGRTPHAIQDKNVCMSLYKLPRRKGLGETHIVRATHAYCPLQFMEEYNLDYLEQGYMFGRYENTVFMLHSNGELKYRPAEESIKGDNAMRCKVDSDNVFTDRYDLINENESEYHYWIAEVTTIKPKETLKSFINKKLEHKVLLENNILCYNNGNELKIIYGKASYRNGELIDTQYSRYENPYSGIVERKPQEMTIECNGQTLKLDFINNIREEQ